MVEKTIREADKTLIENDDHRRLAESVDTTKTPEEEIKDPRRGRTGLPDAKVK